jgi:hypothetical protein
MVGLAGLSAGPILAAPVQVLPLRHDGQTKSPPGVLPDESSSWRKNIPLSERQNL